MNKEEKIKEVWEKLKEEQGYTQPTKNETNEVKSERDLFRVIVGEDGLVKQIITNK